MVSLEVVKILNQDKVGLVFGLKTHTYLKIFCLSVNNLSSSRTAIEWQRCRPSNLIDEDSLANLLVLLRS